MGVLKEIIPMPPYIHKGNILFNVRGTNGSGKSYTLKPFIEAEGGKVQAWRDYKLVDHGQYCVLGKYETACGGLDTIREFSSVVDMVKERIPDQHVMMEGVLWSTVYKSSSEMDAYLRGLGHTMFWMFMETSLKQCMANISKRRLEAGDERPIPKDNVQQKIKGMNSSLFKAQEGGSWVRMGTADQHREFIRRCLASPADALRLHRGIETYVRAITIEADVPDLVDNHVTGVQAAKTAQANSLFDAFGV